MSIKEHIIDFLKTAVAVAFVGLLVASPFYAERRTGKQEEVVVEPTHNNIMDTVKVVVFDKADSLMLDMIDTQSKKIDSLSTEIAKITSRLKNAERNIRRIDLDLDAYD